MNEIGYNHIGATRGFTYDEMRRKNSILTALNEANERYDEAQNQPS
jgi:hypothetical protein